ncbi:hypothetical protein [Dokdonia sp.]|uniref:hypothetical protein n=1 Tax=Dokdonia sp. TaxID=2024995 RepID=UPI003266754E
MAADKITFTVKSEGLPGVEKVLIGNMTDPTGIEFWAKVNANPWVWGNDGHNANSFGLVMNYYDSNANQERTAFHVLDVSPQDMEGDVTVEVTLKPCTIAPGNAIQAIASIDGQKGIAVNKVPGEASCDIA